jgi:phospholipase C
VSRVIALVGTVLLIAGLGGCVGLAPLPGGQFQVQVALAGGGTGTVTSNLSGISCPSTCTANFQNTQTVALSAAPAQGFTFVGWSGSCSGTSTTCSVTPGNSTVTATFGASLSSINHIIVLVQENRSFDSYFGAMRGYWAANGIPDQQFDGLAQFNPPADPANAPTNPGCDPAFPFIPPSTNRFCQIDSANPIASFHFKSQCVENVSPSWNQAHHDWNQQDPTSSSPTLDGFVYTAANFARQQTKGVNGIPVAAPFFDVDGFRAMGYYDWTDLNYYYALATAFATSDTWFSPVMTRTPPNRDYLLGGTSHGYAYQIGANPPFDSPVIPTPTIFEQLSAAGVSWKIYIPTQATRCANNLTVTCLLHFTYIHDFKFGKTIAANPGAYVQNIVPLSQFFTDAINGTLPQVALIEPASNARLDEHPLDNDPAPGTQPRGSVQAGAAWVSTIINAVMCGENGPPSGSCTPGPSWKDSVFILTWDEFGGFYDHVPPVQFGSPDGIGPVDLFPNDPCFGAVTPNSICDFSYSGFRVPLVVVSPFTKQNFVSHQARDFTAILKLIEDRFGISPLSNRDAIQVGLEDPTSGFFDFANVPWKTPPTNLPQQADFGPSACFVNPPPP